MTDGEGGDGGKRRAENIWSKKRNWSTSVGILIRAWKKSTEAGRVVPETCLGAGTPSSGGLFGPPSLQASKLLSGPLPSLVRKYTCCAEVLANPTVAPRQDTHAYISDLTLKDQGRAPFLPPRGARFPWLAITHHFFMDQAIGPGRFCDFASQPALNIKIYG